MSEGVRERLLRVRDAVRSACRGAGRPEDAVRLVAVSKTKPTAAIREALAAGQADLGENYAQELRDKARELAGEPGLRWHFIGPLQRNKARYVVGTATLIHAVDSAPLLHELERLAAARALALDVLVQVNLAAEPQKSGVAEGELPALLDAFAGTPHVTCRGLMLLPPWDPDPEACRPLFRALRALRDRLAAESRPRVVLAELSMGMSHDFAVAIAEGATLVRVGTAIFGER